MHQLSSQRGLPGEQVKFFIVKLGYVAEGGLDAGIQVLLFDVIEHVGRHDRHIDAAQVSNRSRFVEIPSQAPALPGGSLRHRSGSQDLRHPYGYAVAPEVSSSTIPRFKPLRLAERLQWMTTV